MPARNSINHIPSSPVMKQGIVTILGSDCQRNKSAASIRRTLSADMSSKKWLGQNGFFPPLKKIVSPSDSSSSSPSEGKEEFYRTPGRDDVWRSIQANKEMQEKTKMEPWGSILSQKSENSLLPPPYVHPLVKRSSSGLSEKSLEICTERLGSETGSDCFSSNCSTECLSEGDEVYKENREALREYSDPFADLRVLKYKSSPARPLPPPIPSIASGSDGATRLQMQSRRENGRLILEAVSVSPKNCFHARRGEGRLVLTLIRDEKKKLEEDKKVDEEVFGNMEDVGEDVPAEEMVDDGGEDGGCEEEDEFVVEKELSLCSGMISVHKKGLVMKKLVGVGNMNATWPNKDEEEISIPQSLPPPARLIPVAMPPPTAASFNAYEYFWRNKTTVSDGFVNLLFTDAESVKNKNSDNNNNNNMTYENRDLMITKGNKGENLVPYLRGCKEPRRSLLEPYCIATS